MGTKENPFGASDLLGPKQLHDSHHRCAEPCLLFLLGRAEDSDPALTATAVGQFHLEPGRPKLGQEARFDTEPRARRVGSSTGPSKRVQQAMRFFCDHPDSSFTTRLWSLDWPDLLIRILVVQAHLHLHPQCQSVRVSAVVPSVKSGAEGMPTWG